MLSPKRYTVVAAAALLGLALSTPAARADTVDPVQFFYFAGDADATAVHRPQELQFSPSNGLRASPDAPGATGDGTNHSPGIYGIITGGLPGVDASPPGNPSLDPDHAAPFNILSDLTLTLSGFAPVGSATFDPSDSTISQTLGAGHFEFSHPAFGSTPLLAGDVAAGSIVTAQGVNLQSSELVNASILSDLVTYTNSILADSFAAAGLGHTGSFSFAINGNITGNFGFSVVRDQLVLNGFAGDATGSFYADPVAAPSPAVAAGGFSLLGALAASRLTRRRRQQPTA